MLNLVGQPPHVVVSLGRRQTSWIDVARSVDSSAVSQFTPASPCNVSRSWPWGLEDKQKLGSQVFDCSMSTSGRNYDWRKGLQQNKAPTRSPYAGSWLQGPEDIWNHLYRFMGSMMIHVFMKLAQKIHCGCDQWLCTVCAPSAPNAPSAPSTRAAHRVHLQRTECTECTEYTFRCLSLYLSTYLSVYLCMHVYMHVHYLSLFQVVCLSICYLSN